MGQRAGKDGLRPQAEGLEYQVQGLRLYFVGGGKPPVISEETSDMIGTKLLALIRMWLDGNGAIPVSTEFSVLPSSFSLVSFLFHFPQGLFTLFKPPILYSQLMICVLHRSHQHYHHHVPPPHLSLQPFLCSTCPCICVNTPLPHWEIFNSCSTLFLIPLPVL